MKNASWVMGLPILAAVLTACGGGSSSSSSGDSGASTSTGSGISSPTGGGSSSSTGGGSSSTGGGSSSSSSGGGSNSSTGGNGVGSGGSSSSYSSIPGSTTNLTTPMGQAAAARLLMQGSFGATQATLASTATQSYSDWFTQQAAASPSLTLPHVPDHNTNWSTYWLNNSVLGNDQLRQRMAFALSEIMVTSGNDSPVWGHNQALAYYYDILVKDSLGSFRQLLQDVTLSPAMGMFLSMMWNDKPNPATGSHADQNYGREVMQLFTIGLVKLNIDGSVVTDGGGAGVPTYDLTDIVNMSNVFTGWGSAPTTHTGEDVWRYHDLNESAPMVAYQNHHDTDAKTIIGGVQIPGGQSAEADLKTALDTIFNHPNVGPFLGKQLIQRLVTSNPSPAYVQRVAQVFNNDGTGARGNLLAVARAILTDPEAVAAPATSTAGKLREPLIRMTNLWRAFNASNSAGMLNDSNMMIYAPLWFLEYPLYSPSVFNFFQPSYSLAGPITAAGMVAPEFQITNEASLVNTDNMLQILAYQYVDGSGNRHAGPDYDTLGMISASGVFLHTAQWEALAADPASLVDELNLVLMGGQMPADMRTVLINYATAIPASSPASRVVETAELVMSSPQYAVQL